jgi:hypothetical protein
VDQTLVAFATEFDQVDESADNFSFLHNLKKFKEREKEELKTQCTNLHTVLSNGETYCINGEECSPKLGFPEHNFTL